jgi:hypothetical protein
MTLNQAAVLFDFKHHALGVLSPLLELLLQCCYTTTRSNHRHKIPRLETRNAKLRTLLEFAGQMFASAGSQAYMHLLGNNNSLPTASAPLLPNQGLIAPIFTLIPRV